MRAYRFWSFVVGLSLLAIVGGVAASLKYRAVINARANEELAAEVAKVQACSEPLTGGELNAYYQLPKDRPDMTAEILAALVPCESKNLGKSADKLPIIGLSGNDVPSPPEKWSQLEEADEFLAAHDASVKTFDAVYRRHGMARYPVDFRDGIAAELTGVQSLNNGARLLSLQFHVALHRGHTRQAIDSILIQAALGQTLEGMPDITAQLVQESIYHNVIDLIELVVKHMPLADEDLATLRGALASMNFEEGWRLSIIGNRVSAFSACLDADASPAYVPASQTTLRAKDAAMILKVTRELKEATDESFIVALQAAPQMQDELAALNEKGYPMTKMYLIGLPNMPRVVGRRIAMRDTLNLLLSCEQYRRKHASWPTELDLLVPEFVAAVPIDPFSRKPYRIAVTKEEFKVYSFGDYEHDNGGNLKNHTLDSEGDLGFALPIAPKNH